MEQFQKEKKILDISKIQYLSQFNILQILSNDSIQYM